MALEAAFQDLCARLAALREALSGLRTTVVEDKPLRGDVVLVDVFGDAAEDLLGWLEEALAAASAGQRAVDHSVDLDRARRSLITCQERFSRIAHRFSTDLAPYERVADLTRLGRERGGEWRAWANSVKEAFGWCHQPLFDVNQALFRCWQEIAERATMSSVSIRATNTNVGQRITLPKGEDVAPDGVA